MTLNPNVNIDTGLNPYADHFYPDEGYALWRDNEDGNLDDGGQPLQYVLQINIPKNQSAAAASHIWAKLIDETMESFYTPPAAAYGMRRMAAAESAETTETSHTYTDENGVEREKKGVY